MQDKDFINGVIGKYTDHHDERGVTKKNDDLDISKATAPKPPGLGTRHLQTVLLFLGLFMSYTLRTNISVGIVAMTTEEENGPTYSWTQPEKALVISSFFWGYLLAQVPVSQMAQHFGAKILLTIGSLMCGLLTLITPWAASVDLKFMIVSRVLQGLFQGFFYPCVHTLLAKWVHPSERGVLTTFAYSGTQMGSVVMLALSGVLASTPMGWPLIFYVSGGGTIIWTIVWMILGSSSPEVCSRISIEEKKFIESMPGSTHGRLKTPWLSILRSGPVYALIIVHATQCWGFWTLLTETPTYLKEVFQMDIKTNAILSALPYLAMWIISLVVCPISDLLINRGYIGVAAGRKIFNSIGHWGPALALIILPYLQKEVVAVTVLTIAVGLDGFTYCGYICNHMDLSPNFAGSLMGLTNSLANILSILGPTTVGLILTDTKDIDVKMNEWRLVFFIAAGFFFAGNLIFVIFGKAEIQPWNEVDEKQTNSTVSDEDRLGSNVNIVTVNSNVNIIANNK